MFSKAINPQGSVELKLLNMDFKAGGEYSTTQSVTQKITIEFGVVNNILAENETPTEDETNCKVQEESTDNNYSKMAKKLTMGDIQRKQIKNQMI